MAGKDFLGGAYRSSVKFAQGLDQYAGIARNVLGAVAPVVGSLSGPMGGAVGNAVGAGMKALGTYDTLKTQAMSQVGQAGAAVSAARRGLNK